MILPRLVLALLLVAAFVGAWALKQHPSPLPALRLGRRDAVATLHRPGWGFVPDLGIHRVSQQAKRGER